mgnify:CR=1 FL=1
MLIYNTNLIFDLLYVGSLPDTYSDELRVFKIADNYFNGSLPLPLMALQKLVMLDAFNNWFSGSISVLPYDWITMEYFDFGYNSLYGEHVCEDMLCYTLYTAYTVRICCAIPCILHTL